MLSGAEGRDGVGLVELIRGEVEDDIDVFAREDVFGICGGEWNVEFYGAVLGVLTAVRRRSLRVGNGLKCLYLFRNIADGCGGV